MNTQAKTFLTAIWAALDGPPQATNAVSFTGEGAWPSVFAVTELAAASVAAAGLALAELMAGVNGDVPTVRVDRRLASIWFRASLRPDGWALPPQWDSMAGDYLARDGWIRLHTNAPHHRRAAVQALGAQADRNGVAQAVAGWDAQDLEHAIVAAGGCAAQMRDVAAWRAHPQGAAVAGEPLVHRAPQPDGGTRSGWQPPTPARQARPLAGVRVLDLTRVLAGPIATRFLAGYGADVLRLDPPGWDEPGVVPEVTLGKRCARLDLRQPAGRAVFDALLRGCDILVHGYRPGALAALGYGAARLQALRPGLIDVSLSAYGHTGPWAARRGFDSLLQMSSGIADAGMRAASAATPVPLPVQALDHATGYLMAAAVLRGLSRRRQGLGGGIARLSLARTATFLIDGGTQGESAAFAPETRADWAPTREATPWGPASRVLPPVQITGAPMRWLTPACALGSATPVWPDLVAML